MKKKEAIIISVAVLALLWVATSLSLWSYKNSCEPMGDSYGSTWLECDLHTVQVKTEDGTYVPSTFYRN